MKIKINTSFFKVAVFNLALCNIIFNIAFFIFLIYQIPTIIPFIFILINFALILLIIRSNHLFIIKMEKAVVDLEESYKAMEEFSYMVSHNLRSPISNLLGLTYLLLGLKLESDLREIIEHIKTSAERLDIVIRDIREILLVRKNEFPEKPIVIRLRDELKNTKELLRFDLAEKRAKIEYDFKSCEKIKSNPAFIHNIFYSLISNSLKFSHEARVPEIKISSSKEAGKIKLIFEDNGLGIDLKRHGGKLFQMYTNLHRNIEGKGLGLYLIKTQVKLLGGEIDVQSEVGNGTKFIIEFKEL